jgi:hypothetical protein
MNTRQFSTSGFWKNHRLKPVFGRWLPVKTGFSSVVSPVTSVTEQPVVF